MTTALSTQNRRPQDLTPRAIVEELDRYIVGQKAAKRAVAVALRNRWRRQQVPPPMTTWPLRRTASTVVDLMRGRLTIALADAICRRPS